jgi:hypothetical protein
LSGSALRNEPEDVDRNRITGLSGDIRKKEFIQYLLILLTVADLLALEPSKLTVVER